VKRDAVQRWTFVVPTALGITQSTYELAEDGLHFTSDDPMSASELLPWASVRQGGTAAMAGMGGRGMPDLPNWIPSQMEWLLLARTEGGGKAFMRPLPQGGDRDAIVAALHARLGTAWIGERLALTVAQQQLGIDEGRGATLKVVGIVLAVMASLVLLIMLLGLLLHPVVTVPAGFALGGWVCRRGLAGLRDGLAVANTPTAKAGSAALGLVELQGRAVTNEASLSAVTERPSIWWDVTVYAWYDESNGDGEWRQVAARHGGRIDVVEFEDDSGRLPVWLPGAVLLLESSAWDSKKDNLPAAGAALLDEIGIPWHGNRHLRVTEECLAANQTLYVLGTLDERRNLPEPSEASLMERGLQAIRSGQWRRMLVGAVPAPLRIVVAVLIGYLDMMVRLGHGGERSPRDIVAAPPALEPTALVVWKGRDGRPFLVANRPEKASLESLRRRSLWTFAFGGAVLAFTLYQLVELFVGK
jgi:hypothetical protein